MASLAGPRAFQPSLTAAVALGLAALVGADQLRLPDRVLFGFSLDVGDLRLSIETEAVRIERE